MLKHAFSFKPSKQYLVLLITVLLFSALIVCCLPITIWMKLFILLFLMPYGSHIVWQYGLLRGTWSIKQIQRQADGKWLLHTNDQVYQAELRGDSTVTNLVSVLRFQIKQRRLPVAGMIFRDSLERDAYRQLVVVLRMH